MGDGCTAAILSTDMSKAFDSLHPMLLLAKLEAYGLSQSALSLMNSYFCDRLNRTRILQALGQRRTEVVRRDQH